MSTWGRDEDFLMGVRLGMMMSSRLSVVRLPEPVRSPRQEALEGLGRIDVITLREWLPPGQEIAGADTPEWRWVRNVPRGPSPEAIKGLEELQRRYGVLDVTTGNAYPPAPDLIGLYISTEVAA